MKFSARFLRNEQNIIYLCLFLILIGINYLPKGFLNVLNSIIGRIIILCLIIYLGYKNTKLSILLGFLYLLIVVKTQKESNKETFYQSGNKDKPMSNYCVHIDKSGQCPKGTTLSTNNSQWCSPNNNNVDIKGQPVGATCVQYCPPKVCVAKGKDCKHPFQTSRDDPTKCCIPDKNTGVCYCGPSAGLEYGAGGEKCPSCTMCGCQDEDGQPEEETCDQEEIVIKVCKKPTPAPTVAPPPPPEPEDCCQKVACPTPGQAPTPAPTSSPTSSPTPNDNNNNLFDIKRQYVSDPYLKEDSRGLYERTNPFTKGNSSYDDFNIN
jgi:hypothetical protein